jgi:hypothetical protein
MGMSYWLSNFLAGISFDSLVNVAMAGTALAAAIVAARGVNTWRMEMVGRRRAELAEETLARFYEARDHLAWARFPGGFQSEGQTRERIAGETEDEAANRNSYYRTVERMNSRSEFWSTFDASRYRFRAVFGSAAAEPFDAVRNRRHEVSIAVGALIRHDHAHRHLRDRAISEHNEKLIAKWERTIGWGTDEADDIAAAIEAAVASMEKTCRPAIDGFYRAR